MARHNFVAEGWSALHNAALDRGAEVDYCPLDYPELKTRSYLDGDTYTGLVSPIVDLVNIDIEMFNGRSTLIGRAIWRWIRRTAMSDVPELWEDLYRVKTRVGLLAAFHDATHGRRPSGSPDYHLSDPYSAVRFGYWLFRKGRIARQPPIAATIWGLAIIGAAWGEHLRCGVCKLCFRRSRPGAPYCDSHSQSRSIEVSRSLAYMRYRRGILAKQQERDLADASNGFVGSLMTRYIKERLALPDVLFPLMPVEGWDAEHRMLVASLEMAPRVVTRARLRGFSRMRFEHLVDRLRMHIDPNEWGTSGWPWLVLQAERWFELEEMVAPGRRGKGKRTMAMVAEAIDLANAGRTNGQIASDLRVSPAAVSRWATRYPDFKLATERRDR